MTDRIVAVLICPTCDAAIGLCPTDLGFLLRVDWPHCCGLPMTFHRSADRPQGAAADSPRGPTRDCHRGIP
jgi:hypothetical protein